MPARRNPNSPPQCPNCYYDGSDKGLRFTIMQDSLKYVKGRLLLVCDDCGLVYSHSKTYFVETAATNDPPMNPAMG